MRSVGWLIPLLVVWYLAGCSPSSVTVTPVEATPTRWSPTTVLVAPDHTATPLSSPKPLSTPELIRISPPQTVLSPTVTIASSRPIETPVRQRPKDLLPRFVELSPHSVLIVGSSSARGMQETLAGLRADPNISGGQKVESLAVDALGVDGMEFLAIRGNIREWLRAEPVLPMVVTIFVGSSNDLVGFVFANQDKADFNTLAQKQVDLLRQGVAGVASEIHTVAPGTRVNFVEITPVGNVVGNQYGQVLDRAKFDLVRRDFNDSLTPGRCKDIGIERVVRIGDILWEREQKEPGKWLASDGRHLTEIAKVDLALPEIYASAVAALGK